MAKYRQLIVQDGNGWHLMSPSNPWEALRLAWMLWRYPDRVAALVGVKQEYMLNHFLPEPCTTPPMPPVKPPRVAEAQTDVAELTRLRAETATLRALIARYRSETPLGHQPHMIAHEVDKALETPNV